jgi:hypothetical protein
MPTFRTVAVLTWLIGSLIFLAVRLFVLPRLRTQLADRGIRYLFYSYVGMGVFELSIIVVALFAQFGGLAGAPLLALFSIGFLIAELLSMVLSLYLLRVFSEVPQAKDVQLTGPLDVTQEPPP